ncbi:MAG: DUF2961 domain-containing protein, partial [Planctomycetes bacterium]|nr:DUF2961 domain-containing protein [Planctomycetota bacterium]
GRWPYQRIGVRAYMRSTYDRRGGNEAADASHFLYQLADDFNVTLDVEGAGVLTFARYNHWHGSPWHYVVDGRDHLVQETSTADPNKPVRDSVFLPKHLFPTPLTWTWSVTKGADLNWVPIPFEKSFRMAYSRTRYGTGYYIYQQFVRGIPLSQPIRAWDGETPPDPEVLDLINRAGADLAPRAGTPGVVQVGGEALTLGKNATRLLQEIAPKEPAMLRALEISAPRDQAVALGRARLRVTWDGLPHPSIEAPLALFFGAGTLYNRDGREYLVKAFPVHVRFDADRVYLACYFPMPFFRSAKIELLGNGASDLTDLRWSARYQPFRDPANHVGYFHATYRDHPNPVRGQDLVLLDTREAEGGGDWSGQLVGTSFIFSDRANLGTLEGDPRFFFDDSQTPQAQGTGTEEWGGGGDYWGGQNMTLPFVGHPVGARDEKSARDPEDKIESAYRFLLADLMPFGKNALIRLEHGGVNDSTDHYQTVTYWYGRPGASLVKTDELKIGDPASEAAHRYVSPQASEPYEITSRYEWGPETGSNDAETPLAQPADYAEFEFDAKAGKTYVIWVRGKNLDGKNTSDASWIQFDDDIGVARLGAGHNHPKGFGNWLDRFPAGTSAWSSALPQDPPQTVIFARDGRHRLRLQPRHPRHTLEQIWLSSTQKTLPPPTQSAPAASADEIVLNPADAVVMKGKVRLNEDRTLDIDGQPTPPAEATSSVPAHTDRGRKTPGTSEFTLTLDPKNLGVLLRRKLDYQYPNQRAEVFIADEKGDDWKPAGIWYLAGSNTCVYSNPKEELGATQHNEQTSNRRFRDDEFLVPRDLTEGRSAIRVRVHFTPTNIPLFPGRPLAEQAWTELRYDAYCFVLR